MIIQNINTNSSASKLTSIQLIKKEQLVLQAKNQLSLKIDSLQKKNKLYSQQTEYKQNINDWKQKQTCKQGENSGMIKGKLIVKFSKASSEPKFRTYKQQILRIPKVKQILEKDKFVYKQDIQKRLELIGDVRNDNFSEKQVLKLNALRKPLQQLIKKKKNRRHKTNYKIPLTKNNINSLNELIHNHISHNQKYKNEQYIFLSDADYKEPFDLKKLKFMDQINPLKKIYKQKFPQLKQGVLSKNKLLLEHVILNRNIKRQIKLQTTKNKKLLVKG